MKTLSEIMDTAGDAFASTAAKYRAYVARENTKERENARMIQEGYTLAQAQGNYHMILDVFYRALTNCADTIHAVVPKYAEKCSDVPMVSLSKPHPDVAIYHYRFYRHRGYDLTAQEVTRVLQAEFDQESWLRNIPALRVRVTFETDTVAHVLVVWASDMERVKHG